jgi:hypothetical protein
MRRSTTRPGSYGATSNQALRGMTGSRATWGGVSGMDNVPAAKRWDQGFGVRQGEDGEKYVPWLTRARAVEHVALAAAAGFTLEIVERPTGVWAVIRR